MNRISLTQQFTQMFYNLSLSLECCNLYFSCRFTKKPQNENSLQVPEGNKGEEWTKPMKSRFWSLSTYNLQNLLSFLIKKNSWKIHWNISLKPWSNSLNKSHCALKKNQLSTSWLVFQPTFEPQILVERLLTVRSPHMVLIQNFLDLWKYWKYTNWRF